MRGVACLSLHGAHMREHLYHYTLERHSTIFKPGASMPTVSPVLRDALAFFDIGLVCAQLASGRGPCKMQPDSHEI